eukprot:TRINITY_DN11667_c0_g1_i1.p1 TRINITY_DN11667_c0_g1~~TRINITY_DN11667_c0_g1_i1.p1  ORF type:complete len:188 (+),score=55.52 TRINITY_DN11667_c0_g1_i1:59-565(+)
MLRRILNASISRPILAQIRHMSLISIQSRPSPIPIASVPIRPFTQISKTPADPSESTLLMTDSCIKEIKRIGSEEEGQVYLRIYVDTGGCDAFTYKFSLEDAPEEDDLLIVKDGANLIVDEGSLEQMRGAMIDFVSEMRGDSFQVVENPMASKTCSCKSSFATKALFG